ncbi:hypothetical protein QBC37DRAFT_375059 [Rhypophila decipiens]|uniref:Uncharacterized protein n=1 Tax=Rhypophila decipiens TaxID=261697 RepID=A0AAN6Y4N7_9PEZI|nr:hypothetical protein QBC37DRAFT_375059 [Rhypophila decipiens]
MLPTTDRIGGVVQDLYKVLRIYLSAILIFYTLYSPIKIINMSLPRRLRPRPSSSNALGTLAQQSKEEQETKRAISGKLRKIHQYLSFDLIPQLWSVAVENVAFFDKVDELVFEIGSKANQIVDHSAAEPWLYGYYSHPHRLKLSRDLERGFESALSVVVDETVHPPVLTRRMTLNEWLSDRCNEVSAFGELFDFVSLPPSFADHKSRRFLKRMKASDLELFMIFSMIHGETRAIKCSDPTAENFRPWDHVEKALWRLVRKEEADASWLIADEMSALVSHLERDEVRAETFSRFIKRESQAESPNLPV